MRLYRLSTYWWLLAAGIALLGWLGVQQYRWIARASETERQERRQFLRNALGGIRAELLEQLRRPQAALRPEGGFNPGTDYAALFASRFQQWQKSGNDVALLRGVALGWREAGGNIRYFRMGARDTAFKESEWPAALGFYRADLERRSQFPGGDPFSPFESGTWGWSGDALQFIFPVVESTQPPFLPRNGEERPPGHVGRRLEPPPLRRPSPPIRGWCFLEFETGYIQHTLGDVVTRYFGKPGLDSYDVALISERLPSVLYQSEAPNATQRPWESFDDYLPLFRPPRPEPMPGPPGEAVPGKRPPQQSPPPQPPNGGRGRFNPDLPDWRLVARHRYGSLDEAVGRSRRQSLAFSTGALLLLLGSGILLVISTHRARRLARQQMEFVAGVSHELRTPLTVIYTTSYNLAQGKVGDAGRIRQYGEAIQREVRRLITQVEQMLSFAGIESGRKLYDLCPVKVTEVVTRTLAEYAPAFESEGWHIERNLDADLPAGLADEKVLESVVGNLLQNALKYAGKGRWLGVSATTAQEGGRAEIRITVSDRGPGIHGDDLPHIFEPFYRGRGSTGGSTSSGVGLGLGLVQRHMRAMGGRATVKTASGEGSAFTLHLPVAKSV